MLDREFVEKTINEHKKVYKKRLALLFSKVYDLIEKTERSEEKISLERIQKEFRPIERTELLLEYRAEGKITDDQFEKMTGLPYSFG